MGHLAAPKATVQTGIKLAPAPLLSEERIRDIARRHMPTEGKAWPIQIKPLVFPTNYQEGLKVTRNAEGDYVLDPVYSVTTPRQREAYWWAFAVDTMQTTPKGAVAFHFVIDAQTGEILQKADALAHADTPRVGTGKSQYNGIVPLNTLQQESTGQFVLCDTTPPASRWPARSSPFPVSRPPTSTPST